MKNKTILLTGGTGSLGNSFVENLLKNYKPHSIRIFSRNESKQIEMDKKFNDKRLRFLIGDVQDKNRLIRAMKNCDIVIHTAALKHVSVCEYNPKEAVKTNIIGAMNVIDAALDTNVPRVLFISSDKSVHPTTFYGATKMTAEKLFVQANFYSGEDGPRFSCIRFGNLVGSSGSVIPLFKQQKKDGVITITNENMTRFWITLGEASDFIVKSLDLMTGGEVFIPKMRSIRIVDLAKAIAPDAEIKIIGMRPGEKLHESIIAEHEIIIEYDDYFIVAPHYPSSVSMGGQKVFHHEGKSGFNYHSDNDKKLSIDEIMKLISH